MFKNSNEHKLTRSHLAFGAKLEATGRVQHRPLRRECVVPSEAPRKNIDGICENGYGRQHLERREDVVAKGNGLPAQPV